jgi:uncharacterized protein
MNFFAASKFYKNFKPEDLVYVYAILGGTPGYLLEFDDKKSVKENIIDKFLRKDTFLFQDAEFVLKEELKEPKFYFSILRAIALGKTKISDIMNESGLDKGIVGKYLSVLIDLDIIAREVPVTEKHPHKSRKGIYILKDNFYKFWFRFVFPNTEEIERKMQEQVINSKIMPELDQYTSFIFEAICKEWLWKLNLFSYSKIGRWWEKEEEIDIIALNEKDNRILFAECKWQDNVDVGKIIKELRDKSKLVEWGSPGRNEEFAIFAKSFKSKYIEKGVYLFDLDDLIKSLK